MKVTEKVRQRPNESATGAAAALVAILVYYEVIPVDITWAVVLLLGALPGAISWIVDKLRDSSK